MDAISITVYFLYLWTKLNENMIIIIFCSINLPWLNVALFWVIVIIWKLWWCPKVAKFHFLPQECHQNQFCPIKISFHEDNLIYELWSLLTFFAVDKIFLLIMVWPQHRETTLWPQLFWSHLLRCLHLWSGFSSVGIEQVDKNDGGKFLRVASRWWCFKEEVYFDKTFI